MSETTSADITRPALTTGRKVIIGVLAAFIIGAGAFLLVGGGSSGNSDTEVIAGAGADSVVITEAYLREFTTYDDEVMNFEQFAGKPIVLNFFASWCPGCIAEMPAFELVGQELGDDVQFVGLAVNDRTSDAQRIVAETGVTYFTAHDSEDLVVVYKGAVMPSTVFISADGQVLKPTSAR